jgi:hypothetical protein
LNPVGITGDALPLQGDQWIEFTFGNQRYRKKFIVCILPTEADGLVGTDFLSSPGAKLDLENQTLDLRRSAQTHCRTEHNNKVALTLFPVKDGQDGRDVTLQREKRIATASEERLQSPTSPWQFSAILVPKRSLDGKPKYRFCVDFRALNQITRFDAYALPLFDETMSTLHHSKCFSTLDCESGFNQVKMAEEDKAKTAFSTPKGSFRF